MILQVCFKLIQERYHKIPFHYTKKPQVFICRILRHPWITARKTQYDYDAVNDILSFCILVSTFLLLTTSSSVNRKKCHIFLFPNSPNIFKQFRQISHDLKCGAKNSSLLKYFNSDYLGKILMIQNSQHLLPLKKRLTNQHWLTKC